MILISKNNCQRLATTLVLLVLCVALLVPTLTHAQALQSLSVTPTLFEMAAEPGQVWQSKVKVVNSNDYPITVYASAVNFAPQGESGRGKLLPVIEELSDGATFAEWITIPENRVTIEPETSREVPFLVKVPEDAAPGSHFAAILIGTQPPERREGELQLRTSQVVTSLFFVRIAGDVTESGTIRSFTTSESFVDIPKVMFELRFENKGNVHLQPQGTIEIFNMWGKPRGKIPINHQTNFGNVLPESIRQFDFRWEGEQSFSDIGRYRASVTLAYGTDQRQFVTDSTYFWVVPVKPLIITVGSVLAILWFISWAIRAYVRRMLAMAGVEPGYQPRRQRLAVQENDLNLASYQQVSAPVRSGWRDLKERLTQVTSLGKKVTTLFGFIRTYRLFFIGCAGFVLILIVAVNYFASVTQDSRDYEVVIENPGSTVSLSGEEIAFNELLSKQNLLNRAEGQVYELYLSNTSGVSGVGAEAAARLVGKGYEVTSVDFNEQRTDKRSVVVFDLSIQDEAVKLSRELGGALLSANTAPAASGTATIRIFVGEDQVDK